MIVYISVLLTKINLLDNIDSSRLESARFGNPVDPVASLHQSTLTEMEPNSNTIMSRIGHFFLFPAIAV
jgi:hypothetical protein